MQQNPREEEQGKQSQREALPAGGQQEQCLQFAVQPALHKQERHQADHQPQETIERDGRDHFKLSAAA